MAHFIMVVRGIFYPFCPRRRNRRWLNPYFPTGCKRNLHPRLGSKDVIKHASAGDLTLNQLNENMGSLPGVGVHVEAFTTGNRQRQMKTQRTSGQLKEEKQPTDVSFGLHH